MARERTTDAAVDAPVPDHTHAFEHNRKPRRVRKLALLLALAGGTFYLVRRTQRRAEIDEGVWHEAPTT
jgi:hypothetical protein